jgi:hypothetical protein
MQIASVCYLMDDQVLKTKEIEGADVKGEFVDAR